MRMNVTPTVKGSYTKETKGTCLLNSERSVYPYTGRQYEAWSILVNYKYEIWSTQVHGPYDQYPFAIVYKQEVEFWSFHQQNLTNGQWYDRFNTKVDIVSTIGVTIQHKVLLGYVAQQSNTNYDDMSTKKEDVKKYVKEGYLSYVFLKYIGKHHNKLKNNLQNNFITGDDRMPKKNQMTLHLLDNYIKNPVVRQRTSE